MVTFHEAVPSSSEAFSTRCLSYLCLSKMADRYPSSVEDLDTDLVRHSLTCHSRPDPDHLRIRHHIHDRHLGAGGTLVHHDLEVVGSGAVLDR